MLAHKFNFNPAPDRILALHITYIEFQPFKVSNPFQISTQNHSNTRGQTSEAVGER